MSERQQIRRGTEQENNDFVGAQGELTMDTENNNVRVHDGTTGGGWILPNLIQAMHAMCPDYSRAQGVSMPFTATKYGWFIAHAVNTTTTVYVNGVSVAQGNWAANAWSGNLNCQIFVKPGDTVTGATGTMRFIPSYGN